MLRSTIQTLTIILAGWFHACGTLSTAQEFQVPNPFEPLSQQNTVAPSQNPETPPEKAHGENDPVESSRTLEDGAQNPQPATPEVKPDHGVADEASGVDPSDADAIKAEPKGDEAANQPDANKANKVQAVLEPLIAPPREDLLQGDFKKPYLIEVDQQIDEFFSWYLLKSLEAAQVGGADLVIVKLTTPGGELETTLELANHLLSIQWAKVVFWIPKEAISGGAILSLSANAIYMKPSAAFGDAGPIFLTPWGDMIHAEEKIVSYTATKIRELAKQSGRPTEVAAAMADRKLKVFECTHKESGRVVFLSQAQVDSPKFAGNFNIGLPIEEAGNNLFLTVGGKRAKQLQLCDELFESETELLKKLSAVEPTRISLTARDKWVFTLNRPWLTTLLLIVGAVCLYIEFTVPGVTLPGLISLLCFSTFFWSHILGGTAGGLEIMIFIVGVICLLLEIFVLPGFGIFGITGMGLLGLSLLMATQDFLIPQTQKQWQQLEGNGLSIAIAGIVVAGIVAVQVFWFDSLPGMKPFQLRPEQLPPVSPAVAETHPAMKIKVGDPGTAYSDLRPSGKAMLDGELVDVLSEGDYVEQGSLIYVLRIEGNIVTVRKLT